MPHSRCNKHIKMWVEWPLEYVIMKKSTIMESFLVEMGLLEILTSFVVSNENYVSLQVLEYKKRNPCRMDHAIEGGKLISFQPICYYFQIREIFLVTSYVTKKFLHQFYYFRNLLQLPQWLGSSPYSICT